MVCVHILNKCRLTKREREGERIGKLGMRQRNTQGVVKQEERDTNARVGRDGWASRVEAGELWQKWIE